MEVRPGYKLTEVGMIPEEWEVRSLFDLAERRKDQFDDGDWIEAEYLANQGVRLVQTGNIGEGDFVDKESKKYISDESYTTLRCKSLTVGDILICRLAEPAGRACILPDIGEKRVITSVDVTIFRPLGSVSDRIFLINLFNTHSWYHSVNDRCGGTTRTRISRSELGKINVPLPPVTEQRAIAQVLSEEDALIKSLDQLITKKRDIKQAVMQQLLTGKKRLPGFIGEWHTTNFGELFSKEYKQKQRAESEAISFIGMEDVSEAGVVLKQNMVLKKDVQNGLTWFERNDVLVAKITPCFENGKGAILDGLSTKIGCGSTEFHVLSANSRSIPRFIYYHTRMPDFRGKLEREMTGTAGQKRVPFTSIQNYLIKVPPTIGEQIAVAKVLSDIDVELLALEQRRDKTKLLKQAMMQELLTGRIRLI